MFILYNKEDYKVKNDHGGYNVVPAGRYCINTGTIPDEKVDLSKIAREFNVTQDGNEQGYRLAYEVLHIKDIELARRICMADTYYVLPQTKEVVVVEDGKETKIRVG